MRVSAKAAYACVAVLELAANYAEPHPVRVKDIATAHELKPRFLVQILLQLKGAGLVVSVRGAAGGYQLARTPNSISLAEVINAIDRTAAPRTAPAAWERSPAGQAILSVWQEAQALEQRLLEETTLADLVRRTQQGGAFSYQI